MKQNEIKGKIITYKDLIVWQKGVEIVLQVYKVCESFPNEEKFALVSQLKRASVSIPLNIAEGHGRQSTKSYRNFLTIARASNQVVETGLLIASKLGFIDLNIYNPIIQLVEEENRMLNVLISKLTQRIELLESKHRIME